MFVAASTDCFPNLPLAQAIEKLADLEFSAVEIALHEDNSELKPSYVLANLERAVMACNNTRRLDVCAYSVRISAAGAEHDAQFEACCKLAQATKVVTITVPSAELGAPFNEEVERLRALVDTASRHGVRVSIQSEIGRLSQDPDTVCVLCDYVKGLGLTFDPSHYIAGPAGGRNVDKLMKYTHHTLLRDSTKSELQVRVGQGSVEYGRLVTQLQKVNYNRALCVHVREQPDVPHAGEMRKLRLLLESLLL